MSLFLKMLYGCLTGAWGGFLAWFLLDRGLRIAPDNPFVDAVVNGAVIGLFVGALIGVFAGIVSRDARVALRGFLVGLLTGTVGGALGLIVGEALFQFFGQQPWARAAGWAAFGVAIGIGEGVVTLSSRRLLFGAIGGAIGGVLGSLALILAKSSLTLPYFGRALGFTVLGGLIGLFIGLVPVVVSLVGGSLKVVSSGRNEGHQILIDKRLVRVGQGPQCDLKLLGDPTVQPLHAEVEQQGSQLVLRAAPGAYVEVNGQPLSQPQALQKGDRFKVGRQEIVYA